MSYSLIYHIIWSTRNHSALIHPSWEKDLYSFLGARAQGLHCQVHAISGTATHVHLVLTIPPTVTVLSIITRLKNASFLRLNSAHPGAGFGWEPGYHVSTVAASGLERLAGYVKAQKVHHGQGTVIAAYEAPAPEAE